MPGTYEYRREGDKRVPKTSSGHNCKLILNEYVDNKLTVEMPYGEPFTFRFYEYHNWVNLSCDRKGKLYRIGD